MCRQMPVTEEGPRDPHQRAVVTRLHAIDAFECQPYVGGIRAPMHEERAHEIAPLLADLQPTAAERP